MRKWLSTHRNWRRAYLVALLPIIAIAEAGAHVYYRQWGWRATMRDYFVRAWP